MLRIGHVTAAWLDSVIMLDSLSLAQTCYLVKRRLELSQTLSQDDLETLFLAVARELDRIGLLEVLTSDNDQIEPQVLFVSVRGEHSVLSGELLRVVQSQTYPQCTFDLPAGSSVEHACKCKGGDLGKLAHTVYIRKYELRPKPVFDFKLKVPSFEQRMRFLAITLLEVILRMRSVEANLPDLSDEEVYGLAGRPIFLREASLLLALCHENFARAGMAWWGELTRRVISSADVLLEYIFSVEDGADDLSNRLRQAGVDEVFLEYSMPPTVSGQLERESQLRKVRKETIQKLEENNLPTGGISVLLDPAFLNAPLSAWKELGMSARVGFPPVEKIVQDWVETL